jgi:hypothetical protein
MAMVSPYTQEQVSQAAAMYAISGNIQQVADSTGIPRSSIYNWANGHGKVDSAFQAQVNDYKQQMSVQIQSGMVETLRMAIEAVQDRLTCGDEIVTYVKDQGYVAGRRKVSGQSAAVIAGIMADKLLQASKVRQDERVVSKADALIARLDKLAEHYHGDLQSNSIDSTSDKPE